MPRQLSKADLLVEQNQDGNFFYIRPDVSMLGNDELIADYRVVNRPEEEGLRITSGAVLIDGMEAAALRQGLNLDVGSGANIYDFTFFDTRPRTIFASGIHREESFRGPVQVLRSYGNGLDRPIRNPDEYDLRNTDFFDNNSTSNPVNAPAVFFRDVTAKNFADAIFDAKSNVYIMNATISDAFRVLRAHENTTIIIVNSIVNTGVGSELGFLGGTNARILYHNVLWNGSPTPDLDLFSATNVDWRDRPALLRRNIVELDENPLPAISDFFAMDTARYSAQVRVNGGSWVNLDLPNGGFLGGAVGDTLTRLPDLGNGIYEVRAWTTDNGVRTSAVSTQAFAVTTSSFDSPNFGTVAGPLAPATDPGALVSTDGADRLRGRNSDDVVTAGEGDDTISGGGGADLIFGDGGADLISGGSGSDTIVGGSGSDMLQGNDGDDVIRGGSGVDSMNGGSGFDIVDFGDDPFSSRGYVMSLATGTLAYRSGTNTLIERFFNFEGVTGSAFDDLVVGSRISNRIDGGRGADTLTGGEGVDTFTFDNTSAFGADTITDFRGAEELWFARYVDLGRDMVAQLDGRGRLAATFGDTAVEGVQFITLQGHAGRWIEYANVNEEGYHVYRFITRTAPRTDILPTAPDLPSADTVSGGATLPGDQDSGDLVVQAVTLRGGSGDDGLLGSAAGDRIYGAGGDDQLSGGGGDDRIWGDGGMDTLLGGAGADTLYGGGLSDRLDGGDGDDMLMGGDGRDAFDGGAGVDTISFAGEAFDASGYAINLVNGVIFSRDPVSSFRETISNVENAIGTESDDRIIGTAAANLIWGGRGDDDISGGGGRDVFAFDLSTNFGYDRIYDFDRDDRLAFTDRIDGGFGRVRADSAGDLIVLTDDDGGGTIEQTIRTYFADASLLYLGQNDDGLFLYGFA